MNASNRINIIRPFLLIKLLVFTNHLYADSDSGQVEADYQKLCIIYMDVVNKQLDLTSKEMELTENVQNKLPNLFDQLFVHVIRSNADRRYQLIKQYAKQQNKINWECESARLYYDNEFGSP